ncbi:hypothetical protein Hanom_Chr03g00200331 [Helianthus anomalus]
MYKRSCALAHGLAQYFTSAYHRQEHGLLYGGDYITVISLSFGYHPQSDPLLCPAIQPKMIGINSLYGMKIIKRFPPDNVECFKGADGRPFVPNKLPAQFDPIDPPALPAQVTEHEPEMYIPVPPQPHGPPGAPCWARSFPLTRGVSCENMKYVHL